MTEVDKYHLILYVNGSLRANTAVFADTIVVDVFNVFGVSRERNTYYSLSVAALNSVGIGEFAKSDVLSTFVFASCHFYFKKKT